MANVQIHAFRSDGEMSPGAAAALAGYLDIDASVQAYLTLNPPAGVVDATTGGKGVIQLTGDLGGTAASPTVPGLRELAVNLNAQPGVDPSGVAECSAAIQSAIDAASAAGVPIVGRGFYNLSAGVTITNHADLSRCVFSYSGTGTAVTIGSVGSIVRKTIKAPHVVATAKTVTGWSQVAGSVGVKILNASSCRIEMPAIYNFETGLLTYGQGLGVTYNEFTLGEIVNNKVNIKQDSDATGFTNQNTFIGGRVAHNGAEGELVAGTRHLLQTNAPAFPADGNVFVGTSFESPGTVENVIESYGWYNEFIGCRWENYGDPGTKVVRWRGTAKGNVIRGGYEAELLTITADAGAANNDVLSPFVNQTIWLPASSLIVTGAGAAVEYVGAVPYWATRDGYSDEVCAEVLIPRGWARVDIAVSWFSQNGATGNVAWLTRVQSHVAGESVGFAAFAGGGATPAAPAAYVAASTVIQSGVSVTPGPTLVTVMRDGTTAGDTSAGNAGVLGVLITRTG